MAIEFFQAKNESLSAKADGAFLHSSYNPQAEAQRFAQGLDVDFIPTCVVVIEPALGYCAPFLKERFPSAKIGAIRLCSDFAESDGLFDFVLSLSGGNTGNACNAGEAPLSERLYDALGEERLFQTFFCEWPASARIWNERTKEAWSQIKAAMEKAKSVLATREYFAKRWLKNKILFLKNISRVRSLKEITRPVVICASGPSLEGALPYIKRARDKIFLCALSSSISVLRHFGVQPDLCLSEDGGYWAKKHLEPLEKTFFDCPLALATEAACPACLLDSKSLVPLLYDDDAFSKAAFNSLGIDGAAARRNGTVSGSALELFLGLTDQPIFFAGLDLQSSAGQSHSRPNALEAQSAQSDCRLRPKEQRLARSSFANESLELYRAWFCNYKLGGRKAYRLQGKVPFKSALGQIVDISADSLESRLPQSAGAADFFTSEKEISISRQEREKTIKEIFLEWAKSDDFKMELFPADAIIEKREKDENEKARRSLLIKEKSQKLCDEIFG